MHDSSGQRHRPTLVPTDGTTLDTVTDAPTLDCGQPGPKCTKLLAGLASMDVGIDELFNAFTNPMCGLLMAWQYSGTGLNSAAHFDRLGTFLDDPLFCQKDAVGIMHTRESKLLDKYLDDKSNPFQEEYGWHESTVRIELTEGEAEKWASEDYAPELGEYLAVYYRSLRPDIITAVFEGTMFPCTFNMTPFTQYWKILRGKDYPGLLRGSHFPAMLKAMKKSKPCIATW